MLDLLGRAAHDAVLLRRPGEAEPLAAGLLSLFLLSLAGIPPTVGFVAKVAVFRAAVGAGYWPLVLIGVLASVVAAFFYLRRDRADVHARGRRRRRPNRTRRLPRVAVAVPAALVLALGVFPGLIVGFLDQAAVLRWWWRPRMPVGSVR